jgi:hypothetical protein
VRTPAAWLRSCKRRRPGIYAYRTRRHLAPWRTEWGYVGKSRHLEMRDLCHAGTCGRHVTCIEKPWWDLKVYRITLRLPWWLGWDWITLSLETIAILVLRPRYNWQKNPWKNKAGPRIQAIQRRTRVASPTTYRARILSRYVSYAVVTVAVSMIVIGIGGYMITKGV